MAKKLKLPIAFIDEAIHIIEGAFGNTWLESISKKINRSEPILPFKTHPIGNYLSIGDEASVVNLLELALYLKKACRLKNFEDVIKIIKDDFSTGLLQVAYAFRFSLLGVSNLEFEPVLDSKRKGDISFELCGNEYVAECFVPRFRSKDSSKEMQYVIDSAFEALKSIKGKKRVSIRLKERINAQKRKIIGRELITLIQRSDGVDIIKSDISSASIIIEDISSEAKDEDFPKLPGEIKLYGDADWGINISTYHASDLDSIRRGEVKPGERTHRIFVWKCKEEKQIEKEESSPEVKAKTLSRKINRKLDQIKLDKRKKRKILICQAHEGMIQDLDSYKVVSNIQRKIILKRSDIAALFLTKRYWADKNRFQYTGSILYGDSSDHCFEKEMMKLNQIAMTDIFEYIKA